MDTGRQEERDSYQYGDFQFSFVSFFVIEISSYN